jgi:hypothetical protein
MEPMRGGCICGALRFEVTAPPLRVTVCHGRWCLRATGSACMVEPVFDLAALRVTQGEPAVYHHRSTGSSQLVHVPFCRDCGTKLWLTFERFPGAAGVYAGTFDEPERSLVRPREARHLFCELARPETLLPAGTLAYPGHARALDGTLREPAVLPEAAPARDVFGAAGGVAEAPEGA